MIRPRDRASSRDLLPCMEARPWKDGKTYTYRILAHGKWVNLGTDRVEAIRRALDINERHDDMGTIGRLWEQYKDSTWWADIKPRTQKDYAAYSRPLLKVFGEMPASAITAPMVARYLRIERKDAPVRANREIKLLSILIAFAIERGEATMNPCRDRSVRFNKERPKTSLPDMADVAAIADFAATKASKQYRLLALAAKFAAFAGPRQMEFLPLAWPAFTEVEARWPRGKQRLGAPVVMERVAVGPELLAVRAELLEFQRSPLGPVFPNRSGNAYTGAGFGCMWRKLIAEMRDKGLLAGERFTFHDLRAWYSTEHKRQTGNHADLHADTRTTARVYERSKEAKRNAL